eukprot:Pgem_evm1s16027
MKTLTIDDVILQMTQVAKWTQDCAGRHWKINSTMTQFRPPYGSFDEERIRVATDLGYNIALWNTDPKDFEGDKQKTAQEIVDTITSSPHTE